MQAKQLQHCLYSDERSKISPQIPQVMSSLFITESMGGESIKKLINFAESIIYHIEKEGRPGKGHYKFIAGKDQRT